MENNIRVLIAKPGLDGHDKGAKIVALALRDAGFEVIYSGLHQTLEQIIAAATQEAVDVIGLSIMSGAHLPICRRLLSMMMEKDISDIRLVVGGVIPFQDIPALKQMGVSAIFPGGTSFEDINTGMKALFDPER